MQGIVYQIENSLYLNITNRCTNHCDFCIRYKTKMFNQQHPLWLEHEPTTKEIMEAIGDPQRYEEIVFCGYGEPLIRLETVKEIAQQVRTAPLLPQTAKQSSSPSGKGERGEGSKTKIRVNTNGQANLFWGRNILPELAGLIDKMVISLNAQNAAVYDQACHSNYGEKAYLAIIDFIKEAKKYIPEVEASAVSLPQVDIALCQQIAKNLGVPFRVRPYYEEEYVR